MATNKKILLYGICTLGVVTLISLAIIFLSSLKPNEKALSELPHISLAGLSAERYTYVPHPVSNTHKSYGMNILFIRTRDTKLFAYYVPTLDGVTALPINMAWWSDVKCKNFRPDFDSYEIACMDNPQINKYATKHIWSIEGKNLSRSARDLQPVKGVEEHGYFVLHKPVNG